MVGGLGGGYGGDMGGSGMTEAGRGMMGFGVSGVGGWLCLCFFRAQASSGSCL